jgi:hypothetical protein
LFTFRASLELPKERDDELTDFEVYDALSIET